MGKSRRITLSAQENNHFGFCHMMKDSLMRRFLLSMLWETFAWLSGLYSDHGMFLKYLSRACVVEDVLGFISRYITCAVDQAGDQVQ